MHKVAIVQARMGSTRLPGKVLLPLALKSVLWHVVNRLGYCNELDQIVVATTTAPADNAIERLCDYYQIECFRGSEDDVLDRYYQTAKKYKAEKIVRITADCPVIDPVIVDEVVSRSRGYDIYGLSGDFPDGLDCTAFTFETLENTWYWATLPSDREHVCPYMEEHGDEFKSGGCSPFLNLQHHRWTLDEPADYELLKIIFDRLYRPYTPFLTQDILDLFENEPELLAINSHITRNEGYLTSLGGDL